MRTTRLADALSERDTYDRESGTYAIDIETFDALTAAAKALDDIMRLDRGLVLVKAVDGGERIEMFVEGDAFERCVHALERLGT